MQNRPTNEDAHMRKEYVHYLPAWKYSPFGCHMSDVNLTDGGLFG